MKRNYPLFISIFSFILLNIFILFNCINIQRNQNDFFRLHVVANSNSIDDQIIKLNVTKKVNSYLSTLYKTIDFPNDKISNKENLKHIITNNINDILEIANNELKNQNTDYSCYANIGKISYEEKKSHIINMEEGIYDSIQLVLGNGNGENFWSLIFPYSYNDAFNIVTTTESFSNEDIQVKSKIIYSLKKIVKTFKS